MIGLVALTLFNANMVFTLIYQFEKDYQKASYHLLWSILMYLVIHSIVNAG